MKFRSDFIGGIAAVCLLGTTAVADVTATNANTILQAMQEFGFVATMSEDLHGDPLISSRVSDTPFTVIFYGCTENINCSSLLFKAGYDRENAMSALKMNEWNRNKRFSRAYIDDEGDPFMEMDVNLVFEGVGDKNFADTLDWWRLVVEDFEEFIDW